MKKYVKIGLVYAAIVLVALVSLYIVSVRDFEGVYIGMGKADFEECIPSESRYSYYAYCFYTNKWGNPVIVKFDYGTGTEDPKVEDVRCFSRLGIRNSNRAFERLEKGMSIYEVVSKVGIPCGSHTYGMDSSAYQAKDGTVYTVYWWAEGVEVDSEFFVDSVVSMSGSGA